MKRAILSTMLLVMTSHVAFSQNREKVTNKNYVDVTEVCDKDNIFTVIEIPAIYRGGDKSLVYDVNKKLSLDKRVNGTIYLQFIINCRGKACSFKVLRGIGKETDEVLLNIVHGLQNWRPAFYINKYVDSQKTIAFHIKKGKVIIK